MTISQERVVRSTSCLISQQRANNVCYRLVLADGCAYATV